ncbi:MAG: tetratricopeptide repeat protein [Hyphomicrobiaceae bacterium]
MRSLWIFAACCLVALSSSPYTVHAREAAVTPIAETTALDKLFASLKKAKSEKEAGQIAGKIWQHWFFHPNGAVQHLMHRAQAARRARLLKEAVSELDKIIQLAPDYVEGWNQRATVLFMLGRDDESIRDIQQVLRIEPRHFGALSGLGLIHMRAKNWKSAIASFERALKLHPFLGERAFIPALKKKLKGTEL